MRAVVTVIGQDAVGIIARVSNELSRHEINILEITQSVLEEFFAMIMLVDISKAKVEFTVLSKLLQDTGQDMGVRIHVMHEDIFNTMHRI